ncbi:virion structural protein [Synechococcus phage ACG-2014e]|uniref:DUF7483 domain-containing protein n=1 Tax=Synechococcus phage ACG-2014e TaxID=1493510 RepID=A0A0E3F215_9CAUD|nr:virion structural protein [Synechococcus phage ACG-2014e]YP_010355791.1 virion structural protein [Synechococcus phage ACG-2014e]AIX20642.1 hypothetical protein Syn7803C85_179 [Synechococcus phage ACG-2014e]AIX29857.1 hypothetical protein Syn7803US33_176 [Synechococcus phage ACG-2014e]AIX45095.1 hypothetical protein Syn7803C2_176 [Synechococcus phage ACG-2014e]
MAVNEYLTRTPTNSGNRKCWTLSFWVKRNAVAANQNPENTSGSFFNFYTTQGASPYQAVASFNNDATIQIGRNEGGSDHQLNTTTKYRDVGNWMHLLIKWDVSNPVSQERLQLYVNGALESNVTGTYPSLNYNGAVNTTVQHTIATVIAGGVPYAPSGPSQQYFDWFFVDGQALTSEVFGFYKEGDGYISAGHLEATDFKPGQWSPRAPKSIKYTINRSGGFGVNGFYLPMNDSSNPGADFHCEPNSIIKLKGEDLPQPRNGAPTTSDAYVSQLRTDPYAANLVLAVPGITLENTNTELVTNGDFSNGTTGWTGLSGGSLSVEGDRLKITETTNALDAYAVNSTAITTVVGTRYTIKWTFHEGTNTTFTVRFGNSGNQSLAYLSNSDSAGQFSDPGTYSFDFEATATQLNLSFIVNQANSYGYISNVSVKEALPVRDYSADIKGSGTNKTLTAVGNAGVGYELGGYYGSAMTFDGSGDYLEVDTPVLGSGDWTIEEWFKQEPGTTMQNYWDVSLGVNGDSNIENGASIFHSTGAGGFATGEVVFISAASGGYRIYGGQDLRDGCWHHVVVEKYNNIVTLYVDGVAKTTSEDTANYNSTSNTRIGTSNLGQSNYFEGQIQDVRVYIGVAKYKGGFDVPKPYTPVGIEAFRTTDDTCKNNFATWNPLTGAGTAVDDNAAALKDGNLYFDTSNQSQVTSTIGMNSGKWYAEYHLIGSSVSGYLGVTGDGRAPINNQGTFNAFGQSLIRPGAAVDNSFTKNWTATTLTTMNPALGYSSGDVFGFALDLDSSPKTLKFYRNNTLIHTDSTIGDSGHYYFMAFRTNDGSNGVNWADVVANFGQNPSFSGTTTAGTNADDSGKGLFKYAPPTGFLALCEDNLPAPAIADPGKYFKSVLYTGSGTAGHSITGVGFKPDFVWLKGRTGSSLNHILGDIVRGPQRTLFTNNALQEYTDRGIISFDEDGFTLLSAGGDENNTNAPYVAWCWKAGGAAVSNTEGNITTQVSANPTAGFSIVKSNGPGTSGHGLNSTPKFIIQKSLTAGNWNVAHHKLYEPGGTGKILLNLTDPVVPSSTTYMHNATATTFDPLFSAEQIAYVWAEVEGFSKFGSYVGNGSTDGPFVYCGFKPAWVLVKNIDTANSHWVLWDSSRTPYNEMQNALRPNSIDPETAGFQFDFLSNGFKVRDGELSVSESGDTFIFAAFAESPFQTANAK